MTREEAVWVEIILSFSLASDYCLLLLLMPNSVKMEAEVGQLEFSLGCLKLVISSSSHRTQLTFPLVLQVDIFFSDLLTNENIFISEIEMFYFQT